MADPFAPPVGAFRYELSFADHHLGPRRGDGERPVAGGAFAECSGLEATMEPKVIREGGNPYGAHQRAGPVNFATVILRRGMTANQDLWDWFRRTTLGGEYFHRLSVTIRHLDLDGATVIRTWQLDRALPVKFKSSDLNARSGEIAIEELHLVHEGLNLR